MSSTKAEAILLEDRTVDHVELSLPSFYTVRAPYPLSNRIKAGETTLFIPFRLPLCLLLLHNALSKTKVSE